MSINRKRIMTSILCFLFLFSLFGHTALAAESGVTVDPSSNELILPFDAIYGPETITFTLPPDTAVPKADIYILADTTGSMGTILEAVKGGAANIIASIKADNPEADLAFGAGNFKDFPSDSYCFQNDQAITKTDSLVTAAINSWVAIGGGDGPEGQFYAYDRISDPTNPIGWRAGAKKILMVFGDAPAHDPIPIAAAPSILTDPVIEASITAKLLTAGITFIGISTPTGGYENGMDDSPTLYGGDYEAVYPEYTTTGIAGQASRLALATGGTHLIGIDASNIVSVIEAQIIAAIKTINNLSLVPMGDIVPFVNSITPPSYGPLELDETQIKTFAVTFKGVVMGTDVDQVFEGTLDVMADGAKIGEKLVKITVPAKTIDVLIDIKPGSFPNSINLKNKGTLPVAVLGSENFDVLRIDPDTIELEGVPRLLIGFTPKDINGDGYLDWVFHFNIKSLAFLLGETEATLTGETTDGYDIQGTDSIRILK